MRKGISPIIAIIIVLLITVAIGGAAFIYLWSYWTSITENVEVKGIYCSIDPKVDCGDDCADPGRGYTLIAYPGIVDIYIRNIGDHKVNISNLVQRISPAEKEAVFSFPDGDVIDPGAQGRIRDLNCTVSNNTKESYIVTVGGSEVKYDLYWYVGRGARCKYRIVVPAGTIEREIECKE